MAFENGSGNENFFPDLAALKGRIKIWQMVRQKPVKNNGGGIDGCI